MSWLDSTMKGIQKFFVNPSNSEIIVTIIALIIVVTVFLNQVKKPLSGCIAVFVAVLILNIAASRGLITYIYSNTFGSSTMKDMQNRYDDLTNKDETNDEDLFNIDGTESIDSSEIME